MEPRYPVDSLELEAKILAYILQNKSKIMALLRMELNEMYTFSVDHYVKTINLLTLKKFKELDQNPKLRRMAQITLKITFDNLE